MTDPVARGRDHVHRTWLSGPLDVVSVGRAVETLLSAARNCEVLEVDLAAVTFVDPCGARALVVARRAMQAIGGRVRFLRPQPPVARVMHLVGLAGT